MTTLNIRSETADGFVYGANAVWATARTTSSNFDITSVAMTVGTKASSYYIWRNLLKFDTSAIPAGAVITSLKLQLTISTARDCTDACYIRVKKYNWSGSEPIAAGNRETVYDGALAAAADGTISQTNGKTAGDAVLSSELDITWLSLAGYTYYALAQNRDTANVAPTGDDRWYVHTGDSLTAAYKPTLVVEYTLKKIVCDVGDFDITGVGADLEYGREVEGAVGSFGITGTEANLEYGRKVTASIGEFNIGGVAANLLQGYAFDAEVGAFTFTGTETSLRESAIIMAAIAGEYALTGVVAGI